MDTPETIPTWGYKPDGSAKIFDLALGEALPDDWNASPSCITDPAFATAEALSARVAGREYVPPSATVEANASAPLAELEAAIAENERLTAIIARGTEENERLVAELEAADALHESGAKVMDALQADLAGAQAEVASLTARLTEMQADGGFSAAERDELTAKVAELTDDLAKARADLDALTAPPTAPPTAPKKSR